MRFIVFNGSPRGNLGVTKVLIDAYLSGVTGVASRMHPVATYTLQQGGREEALREAFLMGDVVLVAFPVMAGTLPSPVKRLFETLGHLKGRPEMPGLILLTHSAFPNSGQFAPIERYVHKAAERLGCSFHGAICCPHVGESLEGPPTVERQVRGLLFDLGTQFGKEGRMEPATLEKLAGAHATGYLGQLAQQLAARFPSRNLAWARQLIKFGTYAQRRRRPQ